MCPISKLRSKSRKAFRNTASKAHIPKYPQIKSMTNVAFQSLQDNNEAISYDGDAIDLYLDTCVTGALTGYKSDFVEGTFVEKDLGYSSTAAGTTQITGYGIANYVISDDYGRKFNLKIPANYAENCPYRLVSP